jgi:archaemetzincin
VQLTIVPYHGVSPFELSQLANDLESHQYQVSIAKTQHLPERAFNSRRQQYMSDVFLRQLEQFEGQRVLGVLNHDLYLYILKCVYGLADLPGRVAVMSLFRLQQIEDQFVVRNRSLKLAIHELGHTHGLQHCQHPQCVMRHSPTLESLDETSASLCPQCQGPNHRPHSIIYLSRG